ncbi:hypothetical protein ACCO45_012330 [Purpureocillium lilacinum]|uniref:Uncharacterized protein n=1 Tax=Purpureocillium lilacinum TaxID=33203 RepID=A0ACC4D7P9_PURLI
MGTTTSVVQGLSVVSMAVVQMTRQATLLGHGFCEGAKEVNSGDVGVKKTQKPVRRTLSRVVARCTGCLYELDFAQVETDVNLQDEGNFTKCDVGYRLRFLQKSHLPAKRVDDVLYACLFCIHDGHTLDESDSTVVFTIGALFSHLARHPRPQPVVPGVVVVGTPDGARITGIKWPPKYNGEWIFAWHDGVFASVPADVIKLNRLTSSEIKIGGTSHIKARAKRKFAPKDKEKGDWLKFDKNEVITNVSLSHPDHWCWSGTNAKGKWGIFP